MFRARIAECDDYVSIRGCLVAFTNVFERVVHRLTHVRRQLEVGGMELNGRLDQRRQHGHNEARNEDSPLHGDNSRKFIEKNRQGFGVRLVDGDQVNASFLPLVVHPQTYFLNGE